ncbi:hypothetical protein LEP1GSC132_0787 [Leptospira kirschneri str. 200803703]|uniref:Uncharacterized protein n=1 Tax=Leptospira kirschneri str. 200802841 TaxID=1193047 RepID=A0A828Y0M5_9LEPT|nr:hypothetical protein LEP1GSC044_0945 [Leptospira kirschneri serovar Grippotyphosa str. RM52]EKO50460.1 hypothetical protein LEP1GSC131_1169 [Leptospira kirschneri str. 200802841]EKP04040.1 hypothetical protein LEP1GSC018_4078 [Leptospira kirschneri str. 2008720114]EKQ84744.1 hypothetical protein LEP1GSC064_2980 [Leptospira kirschneri serovar Grippotyphosa str. Moskva]EKR08018.1 hypothetical protein LEP1GSC122_2030 [Leptospira kirschneri serovar Valbuzzi str. 200702274]EMK06787.1 hypothetica
MNLQSNVVVPTFKKSIYKVQISTFFRVVGSFMLNLRFTM